jgi:endogenous inhibitor of DNA gyrase (YacG/DUF329 family)
MAGKHLKVKCPTCELLLFYSKENPFRPFCSERCRVADTANWADETYRVPSAEGASTSDHEGEH